MEKEREIALFAGEEEKDNLPVIDSREKKKDGELFVHGKKKLFSFSFSLKTYPPELEPFTGKRTRKAKHSAKGDNKTFFFFSQTDLCARALRGKISP